MTKCEQALTEARQVLTLTALQKKPNPALIRLAQAVVDAAQPQEEETPTREWLMGRVAFYAQARERQVESLRDIVQSLLARTWLSPVAADEMNRRDRWLADQIEAAMLPAGSHARKSDEPAPEGALRQQGAAADSNTEIERIYRKAQQAALDWKLQSDEPCDLVADLLYVCQLFRGSHA